jgi:CSLREA domain-containing protein
MDARRLVAVALLGSGVLLLGPRAAAPAGPSCTTFAPELRDLTVNQGLSTYSALVQGKETLVRAYLGLPSCANIAGGAAVEIDAATLKVTNAATGAALTTLSTTPSTLGPAFPDVTTSGTPTSLDSPADAKFVIPGNVLAGPAARYTANFTLSLTYKSIASATATPSAAASVTFTTLTGSRTTLSKTVEKPTNKLRILAVPLGETLPAAASDAYLQGLLAMSRYYPVPDGTGGATGIRVGSLTSTDGGIRYTVNGAPLPLAGLPAPATVTLSVTSGSLPAGTYAYRVAAIGSGGESIPASVETTIALASPGGVVVSWGPVAGATGYKVYGRLKNAEQLLTPTALAATATSFTDNGTATPSGAMPKFCGATGNFAVIKSQEANVLQSWNSTNTLYPADIVQGILPTDISNGATEGTTCAEGMAAVNGSQSWVRASTLAIGTTGMESGHNWGDVPLGVPRSDGAYHNINASASYTAGDTNRAYDVTDRLFLPTNFNGFKFNTGWTAQNVLLDPGDWAYALCKLGGATNSECTTSGTVGTAAAALPTTSSLVNSFVLSGVTDGVHLAPLCANSQSVPANGCVRESYTAPTTPTALDPASPYHLVETSDLAGNNVVQDVKGIPVSVSVSEHDEGGTHEAPDTAMTFSAAVPLAPGVVHVEFRNGTTTIYKASLGQPPSAPQNNTSPPIVLFSRGAAGRTSALPRPETLGSIRLSRPVRAAAITTRASRTLRLGRRTLHARSRLDRVERPAARAVTLPGALLTPFAVITFTVVSNGDGSDASPGDGTCSTVAPADASTCTLRAALEEADANSSTDTIRIEFKLPAGSTTITPGSLLPFITRPVIIDGTTQTGFMGTPLVELSGSSAGSNAVGLRVQAGSTTIRGLVINGWSNDGIELQGPAGSNVVAGNYIGTNVSGTAAVANGAGATGGDHAGVFIASGSSLNEIGGTNVGDGNLISGNAGQFNVLISGSNNNVVEGNTIGPNATGTISISPFPQTGVLISGSGNRIGGQTAASRNVISGNPGKGIDILPGGASNKIVGNYIGTDAAGTGALANGDGVEINGAQGPGLTNGNMIGGPVAGEGNVISGNSSYGVDVSTSASTLVQGNYIGTNAAGTVAVPNATDGIRFYAGSTATTIGGTTAATRNVISGNSHNGVTLLDAGTANNLVEGNYIGVDAAGTAKVGNGTYGIQVQRTDTNTIQNNVISGNADAIAIGQSGTSTGGQIIKGNKIGTDATGTALLGNAAGIVISNSSGNVIGGTGAGDANVIAGQTGDMGIAIDPFGGAATGNAIRGNSIYANATLGIDLAPLHAVNPNITTSPGSGANDLQNYPVLNSASSTATASTVTGTLDSTASTTFAVDFFDSPTCDSSGHGEGQTFLGSQDVTTDAAGSASFTFAGPAVHSGHVITATATDPSGNTSEFSACVALSGGTLDDAPQPGPTFTVNTADDHNDGTCSALDCSLREAIIAANTQVGANTIAFNIAGAGVHTITPATALPALTDQVTIDGYTQPGATANTSSSVTNAVPLIELRGDTVSPGGEFAAGLDVETSNSVVRGLIINRGFTYGVEIAGDGHNDNVVAGNFLGTNATGNAALGFDLYGVVIRDGASNNTVGGSALADRNLISGSTGISPGGGAGVAIALRASGNGVFGNLIGTSADGLSALPNADGVDVLSGATNNNIGSGDAPNIIAGNSAAGVHLQQAATNGNVIAGNFVGVKWLGPSGQLLATVGNGGPGIDVTDSTANTLISGNRIHDNAGAGVVVSFGATGARITRNSIHTNGGLGIDLGGDGVTPNDSLDADTGPNNLQNFPVLGAATTDGESLNVSGSLNSAANTAFRLEFFDNGGCDQSGYGEGGLFLGSQDVTTDNAGKAGFTFSGSPVAPGDVITATATDQGGNTSEFSACVTVASAASGEVSSTDADTPAADLRSDIFLKCPGQDALAVVATAVPGTADPSDPTGHTADFSYQKTVGCVGGTYEAKVYDGFSSTALTDVGAPATDTPPPSPVATISAPGTSSNPLEYDSITLSGAGWSYKGGGTLPDGDLTWTASPDIIGGSVTGNEVVLSPPANGGWFQNVDPSIGTRAVRFTLTVNAPDGTATATRTITLYRDDDHDGIPAVVEGSSSILPQGCFATGHGSNLDHNPLNAGQDYDGDGIPNADDLLNGSNPRTDASGACVKQTVYTGSALFASITLTVPPSSPSVALSALTVPYRDLSQISGQTVRISKIDGVDIAPTTLLTATSWKVVNGIGIATFDATQLANYLSTHGLVNEGVTITLTGSPAGSPPPWRFEVTTDLLVIRK